MLEIDDIYVTRVQVDDPEGIIGHLGEDLQVVAAECWRPVAFSAVLARRAFKRGTNHARTLSGEFLLRLAGTLQIKEAIENVGVKPGPNYAVAFGEKGLEKLNRLGLKELEPIDCDDDTAKRFFEKAALVEVL
ncbi:KEOPS complex subunit Cgi121 [Thermococcus sp.]|uniref:KEOPS complex subunit Cgi121 n=1 Tax=Thermococcus sp. TaxID=35749 RepID=UPI00260DFE7A|nr:KEOPS complex subunit Cgi121 [Thermococcus sp.]